MPLVELATDRQSNRNTPAGRSDPTFVLDVAHFSRTGLRLFVRSADWRVEQDPCLHEIERHRAADQSYLEEGVRLLELARNAQRLFVPLRWAKDAI
jgi:hypothetical protein